MSLSKCINGVLVQGRMNVIQSGLFNLNMRIMALGRAKLAQQNKDNALFAVPNDGTFDEDSAFNSASGGRGTFQFGQHIDGANALDQRERGGEASEAITSEWGHEERPEPSKAAEPFVSLRDMLYMKYLDEATKNRRTPLDQSFASIINWMHSRDFTPNNAEAQAVYMASRGRVTLDMAIMAQKKRHEDEKKRLAKIAEPLLKVMEDFPGLDLTELLSTENPGNTDGDIVIDTLFNNMAPIVRLGIVNVMWRRCHKLVTDDFPSKRIPTRDFAADIVLAIAAEDEFRDYGKVLYDLAHDDYSARMTSGLPSYDVVDEIERLKKSAAQASARSLVKPSKAA